MTYLQTIKQRYYREILDGNEVYDGNHFSPAYSPRISALPKEKQVRARAKS